MLVQLINTTGAVGQLQLPPVSGLPPVISWQDRTFVLQDRVASIPIYLEATPLEVSGELLTKDEATEKAKLQKAPFPELEREIPPVDRTARVSTSGVVVTTEGPAPDPELKENGQHKGYWVLSEEERAKGFVRPVRNKYIHVGKEMKYPLLDLTPEQQERYADCGYVKFEAYPESEAPVTGRFWTQADLDRTKCRTVTSMGYALAETYARDPSFYGATFCVGCGTHFPVGVHGEFLWCDSSGNPTKERVGT